MAGQPSLRSLDLNSSTGFSAVPYLHLRRWCISRTYITVLQRWRSVAPLLQHVVFPNGSNWVRDDEKCTWHCTNQYAPYKDREADTLFIRRPGIAESWTSGPTFRRDLKLKDFDQSVAEMKEELETGLTLHLF